MVRTRRRAGITAVSGFAVFIVCVWLATTRGVPVHLLALLGALFALYGFVMWLVHSARRLPAGAGS